MPKQPLEQVKNSMGFAMIGTSMAMKDELRKGFQKKGYDVTPDQFAVLLWLWTEDGISQRDLAEKSCKTKSNLTRILDSMEKKDLIARQINKEDRRSFSIFLTPKSRDIKDEIISIAIDIHHKIFKGITKENEKMLMGILEKISQNMR